MKRLPPGHFIISTLQRGLLLFVFPLIVGLAGPVVVRAQDLDSVTVTGRVLDQNGGAIPGATIEAIYVKTGATRTTVTDDAGRYRIIQLEPGVYDLRASAVGFAPREKPELSFIAGKNVQLDFAVVPQGVTVDPVTVTADDTPAIDTTRTVVGGTVTTHEVESLPVASRSVLDLIFTLPGVSEEPLSTRDLAEDRNSRPPTLRKKRARSRCRAVPRIQTTSPSTVWTTTTTVRPANVFSPRWRRLRKFR